MQSTHLKEGGDLTLQNPYSAFLDQVEKPARYIGREKFEVKKNWDDAKCRVALCFPDTYEIGMSFLGFKILYDLINSSSELLAERVFAPWIDMEKQIRDHKLPLVSLESYRPLKEFDILGFTLQYELTYSNILNMLDLGGVNIWQKDRTENDPLVICGGPCATHPEPIAPFMDLVVIGDGEDLFNRIANFVGEEKQKGRKRAEIIRALASWPGIYVPSLYNTEVDENSDLEVVIKPEDKSLPFPVNRFFVENLRDYPIPTETPIPHLTAIFDRFTVELSRGCTEGCRFCQAGMIYRPVRERRPNDVIKSVMDGMAKGGFDEASLTCLSTADYSAITPLLVDLLDKVKKDRSSLGISSLRAYGLDPQVLDKMSEVKNSSLTFAPEAGTERMRKVINKNISEDDMLKTAEDVFSRGWSKMKLYFMIGLPTETDEDVAGIMETALKAKKVGRQVGAKSANITVSASSFVPKPHTPFQWHAMIKLSEIERKQELLWKLSREYRLNFRKHYSKSSYFECIIGRGDRRIAEVIFDAWQAGARFDGWDETFNFDNWMEALAKNNIDPAVYLGTIRLDARLPWDHIDVGLEAKFLEREWKKALKDRLSPPCGKPAGAIVHHSNLEHLEQTHDIEKKKLVCYHCGVACDLQGMIDERKEYLISLDAKKNTPYVRPAHINTKIEDRREKRGQVIGFKYRIEFSKLGSISFISHLDLQKVMARIIKRAGLDVLYSEGYNMRPLISFGPALSLGISSFSEFFDVRVPAPWVDLKSVISQLNNCSEKGIIFKDAFEVQKKDPSIQQLSKKFHYYFPVEASGCVNSALKSVLDEKEIWVESFSKKKRKHIRKNIRPWLLEANQTALPLTMEQAKLVDEVSPCLGMPGISVTTKVEEGTSVRPRELMEIFKNQGLMVGKPIKIGVSMSN